MVLDDVWCLFKERFFPVPSVGHGATPLFNQYNDTNPSVDMPNADEIRRGNLLSYLRSFPGRPSIVLVGEAPGWRGCRFSGIPFTSEAQLSQGVLPFTGRRSSVGARPYSENTATIFWKYTLPYHPQFFAWNCIPFHPHQDSNPLSNRALSRTEGSIYLELLEELLSLVRPEIIVAVGRSAEHALRQLSVQHTCIRHPSRGGAHEFGVGISRVLHGG